MAQTVENYQVIIAGGGPVGLFLAICLTQSGISCRVLESRTQPVSDSRSLGIHPVSLELFEKKGIANPFVEHGIKINAGHAFSDSRKLGSIQFSAGPGPYNFILALPQFRTERILEAQLNKQNKTVLLRGARVRKVQALSDSVKVTYTLEGKTHSATGRYLVGCDGINSVVRSTGSFITKRNVYPDSYIMGDFSDNTTLGTDAAVYLARDGLIESFPLPDNMRRWVVKTEGYISNPEPQLIESIVEKRIGHSLRGTHNAMMSSFGVLKQVAEPMFNGRVILCGDAAHVVSPIGGQGMNLGWINAHDLSCFLVDCLQTEGNNPGSEKLLFAYSKRASARCQKVIRRAELNMRLGRKTRWPVIRNSLVRSMLNTPFSHISRSLFTMRKLEQWPF